MKMKKEKKRVSIWEHKVKTVYTKIRTIELRGQFKPKLLDMTHAPVSEVWPALSGDVKYSIIAHIEERKDIWWNGGYFRNLWKCSKHNFVVF